ncbi:Lsr2 family protein, partial [Propionibacterium freudenreichii]
VTGRRGAAARKQGPSDAAKIREWAKSTGRQVPLRGRIPNAIRAEYEEATK